MRFSNFIARAPAHEWRAATQVRSAERGAPGPLAPRVGPLAESGAGAPLYEVAMAAATRGK
jgi:hypothetical protein